MAQRYPGYDVLAKWRTPSFDETTRAALRRRIAEPAPARFFSPAERRLVEAIVARLIPQPDRAEPVPLAAMLDALLAEGRDQGYRDAAMPPMRDAWRLGLAAIEAEARARHATDFADAPAEHQDAVLRAVQTGEADCAAWQGMDPAKFFSGALLKIVAGLYYAHPSAWSEIGFGGPASPRGYVRLGLDETDPWEAREAAP